MLPRYQKKIDRFKDCREKGINPLYNSKYEKESSWEDFVKCVSVFVANAKKYQAGRNAVINTYNRSDPDYLNALEEMLPELKEIRRKW